MHGRWRRGRNGGRRPPRWTPISVPTARVTRGDSGSGPGAQGSTASQNVAVTMASAVPTSTAEAATRMAEPYMAANR